MSGRTNACPECGKAPAQGRLTCQHCGALLAAVSGAIREPAPEPELPAWSSSAARTGLAMNPPDDAPSALEPELAVPAGVDAVAPVAGKGGSRSRSTAAAARASADATASDAGTSTTPILGPSAIIDTPGAAPDDSGLPRRSVATVAPAVSLAASARSAASAARSVGATAAAFVTSPVRGPEPQMAAAAASPASGVMPGIVAAPSAAPSFPPASVGPDASNAPGMAGPAGAAIAAATEHVDLARLAVAMDWVAALGSGLVIVGLLMPWSDSVIGASGISSYFDTWGLAGTAHLLVFLGALAVAALSIVPSPVPGWVRTGLAGLALGAFVIGLTWPYAVGPLDARLGVMIAFLGGLVLVAAGVVTTWAARHAADPRSV